MSTACCPSSPHALCFGREKGRILLIFHLVHVPCVSTTRQMPPLLSVLGADRCCGSQEPTAWL